MSLVYFHIFLISVGTIFSLGFGLFELNQFSTSQSIFDLLAAVAAFIFATGLAIYLVWFIKKKKPHMNS